MPILNISLTCGTIIVLIIVLRALFLNRLPARTFVSLWNLIAIRLLIPFYIPLRVGVIPLVDTLPVRSQEAQTISQNTFSPIAPGAEESISRVRSTLTLWDVTRIIWLIGVIVLALYFGIAYFRYVRQFRQSIPCEDSKILEQVNSFFPKRPVQVRMTSRFSSPLTYGIIRPVILWPTNIRGIGEEDTRYALLHECVHIRFFDAFSKLIFVAALCFHWFNPLVWCMFFLAGRDLEIACDRNVLSTIGIQNKAAYALALIHLEERRAQSFAFSSYFGQKAIVERICVIMKYRKTNIIAIVVALLLICGTATVIAFEATDQAAVPEVATEAAPEEPQAAIKVDLGGAQSSEASASDMTVDTGAVIISGEPGTVFTVGDMTFEIISAEEADAAIRTPSNRASIQRWSIQLSGTELSQPFDVTSSYPYAKVWINNTGSGHIVFTITKTTPYGTVVNGSTAIIESNTAVSIYSTNSWPADTYYANYTSGQAVMSGSSACRVASTIAELDV